MPESTITTSWVLNRDDYLSGLKEIRSAFEETKKEVSSPIEVTLKPIDLVSPRIAEIRKEAQKPIMMKVQLDPASLNTVKSQLRSLNGTITSSGNIVPANQHQWRDSSSGRYTSAPETTQWGRIPGSINGVATGIQPVQSVGIGSAIHHAVAHHVLGHIFRRVWNNTPGIAKAGLLGAGLAGAEHLTAPLIRQGITHSFPVFAKTGLVGAGILAAEHAPGVFMRAATAAAPIAKDILLNPAARIAAMGTGAILPAMATAAVADIGFHAIRKGLTSEKFYFARHNLAETAGSIFGAAKSIVRAPLTLPFRALQGIKSGFALGTDVKTKDGGASFEYEHRKDILENSNLLEKGMYGAGVAVGGVAGIGYHALNWSGQALAFGAAATDKATTGAQAGAQALYTRGLGGLFQRAKRGLSYRAGRIVHGILGGPALSETGLLDPAALYPQDNGLSVLPPPLPGTTPTAPIPPISEGVPGGIGRTSPFASRQMIRGYRKGMALAGSAAGRLADIHGVINQPGFGSVNLQPLDSALTAHFGNLGSQISPISQHLGSLGRQSEEMLGHAGSLAGTISSSKSKSDRSATSMNVYVMNWPGSLRGQSPKSPKSGKHSESSIPEVPLSASDTSSLSSDRPMGKRTGVTGSWQYDFNNLKYIHDSPVSSPMLKLDQIELKRSQYGLTGTVEGLGEYRKTELPIYNPGGMTPSEVKRRALHMANLPSGISPLPIYNPGGPSPAEIAKFRKMAEKGSVFGSEHDPKANIRYNINPKTGSIYAQDNIVHTDNAKHMFGHDPLLEEEISERNPQKLRGRSYSRREGSAPIIGMAAEGLINGGKAIGGGIAEAFKELKDAAKATAGAFGEVGKSIGSFVGGLFGGGGGKAPSKSGTSIPSRGGRSKSTEDEDKDRKKTPSVANARSTTGALRAGLMTLGIPAIAAPLALQGLAEFEGYQRQQAKFQMARHLAGKSGGKRGVAEAQLSELDWQATEGDEGFFKNFLWHRNWGGGNSTHAVHKREAEAAHVKEIYRQQQLENRELGRGVEGQMENANIGRAGISEVQREQESLDQEHRNAFRNREAMRDKLLETRSKKDVDILVRNQEIADDKEERIKRAKLKETQAYASGQFIGVANLGEKTSNLRLGGQEFAAQIAEYEGSRKLQRNETIGKGRQFAEGSKEAEAFDAATAAGKALLELQQKINIEQDRFNSALKVSSTLAEGMEAKMAATGRTGEAANSALIRTEDEKVSIAKHALDIAAETNDKMLPQRKAELEAAKKHRDDMKEKIKLEDEYQSSLVDRATGVSRLSPYSGQAAQTLETLNKYDQMIKAAPKGQQEALRNQESIILHNQIEAGQVADWRKKENIYETTLRAAGNDRMANIAHIKADAAEAAARNQVAQDEIGKQLKDPKNQDAVHQKALKDQADLLQKEAGNIRAQEQADTKLAMRGSFGFNSSMEFWKKIQLGSEVNLRPPPLPKLGQQPGAPGVPGNQNDMDGHAFKIATADFSDAVDRWNESLNNAVKIGIVSYG